MWSSLELGPLDFKGSIEMLLSSLSRHGQSIPQEQVGHTITRSA